MTNNYSEKRAFYDRVLSVYGRKPVLEILQDQSLDIHRLHLADTNKPTGIVKDILQAAEKRNIEVLYHDRRSLSHISKNQKQDQGAVIDVLCPQFGQFNSSTELKNNANYIAVDRVTNPANLGMIIRAAAAAGVDGIIVPGNGSASLGPLVIKASAGTVFKAPILFCENNSALIDTCTTHNIDIAILAGEATQSLFEYQKAKSNSTVYVMGNETDGVSKDIRTAARHKLSIPMANNVESLNVATAATLVVFGHHY